MDSIQNQIKDIKGNFLCYRNGIVAEALRKLYKADKIIYGLTAPQFLEIANKFNTDINLGLTLWADKNNRESRILSLYLIPPEEIGKEKAKEMIYDVDSWEESELLSFKILRHLPFAKELFVEMSKENNLTQNSSYCLKMLGRSIG